MTGEDSRLTKIEDFFERIAIALSKFAGEAVAFVSAFFARVVNQLSYSPN